MAPGPLCAVDAGEEGCLSGAALGQSFHAQRGIECGEDPSCGVATRSIQEPFTARQLLECRKVKRRERIGGGVVRAQADPVEEEEEDGRQGGGEELPVDRRIDYSFEVPARGSGPGPPAAAITQSKSAGVASTCTDSGRAVSGPRRPNTARRDSVACAMASFSSGRPPGSTR